jgi:hypothetical protein
VEDGKVGKGIISGKRSSGNLLPHLEIGRAAYGEFRYFAYNQRGRNGIRCLSCAASDIAEIVPKKIIKEVW